MVSYPPGERIEVISGQLMNVVDLHQNPIKLFRNKLNTAFVAVTLNGGVISWGNRKQGGDIRPVKKELMRDVLAIYSTHYAFCALKSNLVSLRSFVKKH